MNNLRRHFLLDPHITFLNHGSFGATPRPVFRACQAWQRELERQPVEFLGRRFTGLMSEARAALGAYLGAAPENLVYVTNATVGVNIVARSLNLGPGDEVLATDHEYGACDRAWRFLAGRRGFTYINQPIPAPIPSPQYMLDMLWRGVTSKTRVIFLSHITSPTAITFPVDQICARARQAGILTVVDGAHAPGQIPLALDTLGADFYTGNLHKWLCAPKGAGFLYARPQAQALLEPLVVSWGWQSETPGASPFIDQHEWIGTRDIAAFLSVPAAIQFQKEHAWEDVSESCHRLLSDFRAQMATVTKQDALHPDSPAFYRQMSAFALPAHTDLPTLKARLYDDHRIEVPLIAWNGRKLMRVSVQGYNTRRDLNRLLRALPGLL